MKLRIHAARTSWILSLAWGAACAQAQALDPYLTVVNGGAVSVGGTAPSGNGFGTGVDILGVPQPGSWVSPAGLGQWYNFAAAGNEHGIAAGAVGGLATAGLSVDVAPAGSGVAGLAVNHARFDIWVSDNPDNYGRGGQGFVESQSSFLSDATQYYGALRWQVVALPDATLPPGASASLNLKLMYQPDTVALAFDGSAGTYGGFITGGPQTRHEGAYDAYMRIEAGAGLFACGNFGTDCNHGGGRFLMDVWWAYADAPIDPALLSPAPEPQSWALMLVGLLGVARLASRRRL